MYRTVFMTLKTLITGKRFLPIVKTAGAEDVALITDSELTTRVAVNCVPILRIFQPIMFLYPFKLKRSATVTLLRKKIMSKIWSASLSNHR